MEPPFSHKTLLKSLSVTTFQADSSDKIPKRKQSMQRRLSIQRSVEDLLKNIKFEELNQKMLTERDSGVTTQKTGSGLYGLVNLPEGELKEKYVSNPFFQAHVKHLTRELTQGKKIKKISRKNSLQSEQNSKMTSLVQHNQKLASEQAEIMSRLREVISQENRA